MAKLDVSPHPDGRQCVNCVHYLHALEKQMVANSQGASMERTQAIAQGIGLVALLEFHSAPCTLNPTWVQVPRQSWCGQFSENPSTNPADYWLRSAAT